jgi:hypothetical protein
MAEYKYTDFVFAERTTPPKFYDAAYDFPRESFEQVTRRLLGPKGFAEKSAEFMQDCRKSFDMGRQKRSGRA